MPERAPVLRKVPMLMLKNQPGFPKGMKVGVPSGSFDQVTGELTEFVGIAKEWDDKKIAVYSPTLAMIPADEPSPEVDVVLCADKIFTSPALYPGDIFGAPSERATKLIETKAAHLATEEDEKNFYNPNRGLAPDKQRKPAKESPALTVAAQQANARRRAAPAAGAQSEDEDEA